MGKDEEEKKLVLTNFPTTSTVLLTVREREREREREKK